MNTSDIKWFTVLHVKDDEEEEEEVEEEEERTGLEQRGVIKLFTENVDKDLDSFQLEPSSHFF
jgi:hypothetical protein